MRTALKTFTIVSICLGIVLTGFIAWTYGVNITYEMTEVGELSINGYHNTPQFYIWILGGLAVTSIVSSSFIFMMKMYDRVMYMNQKMKDMENQLKKMEQI